MRDRKYAILPILFLVSISMANMFAQDFDIPGLNGYKKEVNYPVYTPDDLWDYINGGADSYNALGFQELHIVEFTRGRKNSIKLEIYCHSNRDMAFGIYAVERAPTYNFMDIGVQGYGGEGFLNFFKERYYIKIYTHSKSQKVLDAVAVLGAAVDQAISGERSFPKMLSRFPGEGLLVNQEMFISENVIGHSFLSDAFRANYDVNGKSFIIYLFEREDNSGIVEMVQKYLARQDLDVESATEGKSSFEDGYNGDVFMAWRDNMMVIVTGLNQADSELADGYISEILN